MSNYYSDPDGDTLTATLFTDCTWCSVISSGSSYFLTLKPCTGNIGVTDITTTITDDNSVGDPAGVLSTPLISRIDVQRKSATNNGNEAPVFSPTSSSVTVFTGQTYAHALATATDSENDPLTYTLRGEAWGLYQESPSQLEISGAQNTAGTFIFYLDAKDANCVGTLTVNVHVRESNSAPVFGTGDAVLSLFLDRTYVSYNLPDFTDPDAGDSHTCACSVTFMTSTNCVTLDVDTNGLIAGI